MKSAMHPFTACLAIAALPLAQTRSAATAAGHTCFTTCSCWSQEPTHGRAGILHIHRGASDVECLRSCVIRSFIQQQEMTIALQHTTPMMVPALPPVRISSDRTAASAAPVMLMLMELPSPILNPKPQTLNPKP